MTSAFDDDSNDYGVLSIDSWDDEPACIFSRETGFAINQRSVDTLRWYSYQSRSDGGNESLLQSRNVD